MLSTRGAAHHCPADAEAWSNPRRLTGRGVYDLKSIHCRRGRERDCAPAALVPPPRERPMTFVRPECGLRHQPAPQLHR